MVKTELIALLVERTKTLTARQAEAVVDTVFNGIMAAVARGDKVEIRGFGSFIPRTRKAKRGRNPKTGDSVDVPAKTVPFFKTGKELRELLNATSPHPSVPVETPAPHDR